MNILTLLELCLLKFLKLAPHITNSIERPIWYSLYKFGENHPNWYSLHKFRKNQSICTNSENQSTNAATDTLCINFGKNNQFAPSSFRHERSKNISLLRGQCSLLHPYGAECRNEIIGFWKPEQKVPGRNEFGFGNPGAKTNRLGWTF